MDDNYPVDTKKIFFIYSQKSYMNEITKIKDNKFLEETKLLKEFQEGDVDIIVYALILKDNYNNEPIIFEIEANNNLYSMEIKLKDILPETFLFNVEFNNKENRKDLRQFNLPYEKQFKIFVDLQNNKDLDISLSDEYLKNLCLSSFKFIASTRNSLNLDFLFIIFINCYCLQKKNSGDNLVKQFFDAVNITNSSQKNDAKEIKKEMLELKSNEKHYFSNVNEILRDLVKIGGKDNLRKIHIILAYYYLKYNPKKFINLVSVENEYTKDIFKNLTDNRKLFNDFNSDIINFEVLDEAKNIAELEKLLKYLPNMEEFFKEFNFGRFFSKVTCLSAIENKFMDVCTIISPKKEDNIKNISEYITTILKKCKYEGIMIFSLSEDFFKIYSSFYTKVDLTKLKMIKEIYAKYSYTINKTNNKIITQLNDDYYETGMHLISNNSDNKSKTFENDEFINFCIESGKQSINITPDAVAKMIDLREASEDFKNKLLNNDFKKFDLKKAFGNNYSQIIEKIFEQLKSQSDFSGILKNWNINPNVDKEVLEICFKRFKTVLINDKNKKNDSKLTIFFDLHNLVCNLLSISSKKLTNFTAQLTELENEYPCQKLNDIYFKILNKGYDISNDLREHLREYIRTKSGNGPLSIWYQLVIVEENEKILYLCKNLKPEHAVQNEDFVEFPYEIAERISLFIYLYSGKYFKYSYITNLEYFKKSIQSRNEIIFLPFDKALKIYNNFFKFKRLLKYFIPEKEFKQDIFDVEFTLLYDQLDSCKKKYDSLETIINYWNKFFSVFKKNDINSLQSLMDTLKQTPINKFDSKKNEIDKYLASLENAKNGLRLMNSLFFMGLYEINQNQFGDQKQKEAFSKTFELFQKLKSIGKDIHINDFDKEFGKGFKEYLIKYVNTDLNMISDELKYLQDYFCSNKGNNIEEKQKEFDIETITNEIYKLKSLTVTKKPHEQTIEPVSENKTVDVNKDVSKVCSKVVSKDVSKNVTNDENKEKQERDNNKIYKEIFENKDLERLDPEYYEEIINKLFTIYYTGFSYNTLNYSGEEKQINLINDFFEIFYVYKVIYKNNQTHLTTSIKNIIPLFLKRMKYEGFSSDFSNLQNLLNTIKTKDTLKNDSFSNCFINIIIEEIKKENIKDPKDLKKILEYALDPSNKMIKGCIPLINKLFEEKIFSDLRRMEKSDIKEFNIFNDTSLNVIDVKSGVSQELKEKLLFYFECSINRIFDECNVVIYRESSIKEYLKQIVSFLESESKNKNKDKTKNNNLFLLFILAFLKTFLKKYITSVEKDINNKEDQLRDIFSKNDDILYYIIKLHLDNRGDYFDIFNNNDLLFNFPDNMVNKLIQGGKRYFGFDYLFLPMTKDEAKKYNDIIKTIDLNNLSQSLASDNGIVEDLNKYGIDIFYCVTVNLFLSKFKTLDYFNIDEYKILNNWYDSKFKNNEFPILKNNSKNILQTFINEKAENINNNEQLIIILFALRIVLNSLSNNTNTFYKNLFLNPNETISKNKKIFEDYFKFDTKSIENDITNKIDIDSFKVNRFMILSHLLFSYSLNKKPIVINKVEYNDNSLRKLLFEDYKSLIKLARYKGVKYKYNVIFTNILFNSIKSYISDDINNQNQYKMVYENYQKNVETYFKNLQEIKMNDVNMGMNESKKIIFEDFDYYKNNIQKDSYLYYLTTPNIYSREDFINQYHSQKNRPIIELILTKEMDEIINIMSCLPEINKIINKYYYEKLLTITREQSKEESIELKSEAFCRNIKKLQNYLNIDIIDESNKVNLSDLINIKGNKIYKMYEEIIKKYNSVLLKIEINKKNESYMKPIIIQDFLFENYFNSEESGVESGDEKENNPAYKRLFELIGLYSERDRFKNNELNVINGDAINYNFALIEKQLEKELILGKSILSNEQRTFIFNNEVFSGERNNLLSELKKKYPQEKIQNEAFKNDFENSEKEAIKAIYHNMQYIIIYLVQKYNKKNDDETKKISLKTLVNAIKKDGYNIEPNFPCNNICISNVLSLYEVIEEMYFDKNKDDIKPNKVENNKKEDVEKYFEKDNLLINKEKLSNAVKKYYLRYCLGDYEKKEDILKNMDMDKIIKDDIWEEEILKKEQFKEEFEKLKTLNGDNNNYLINYLLNDIFNMDEEVENNPDEPEEEEEGDEE